MKSVSLFEALFHVVPWQIRRPVPRDVTLLHDAEFRILLHELRYPPVPALHDPDPTSIACREWDNHRKR
jgi:hypothetical protein